MTPFVKLAALAAILATTAAVAQDMPMHGHDTPEPDLPAACQTEAAAPSLQGMEEMMQGLGDAQRTMMQAMMETHGAMMAGATASDPDVAFACAMIPHHRSAVGMAEALLEYGDDETMRALAQDIIAAQEAEIAVLTEWLAEQAP